MRVIFYFILIFVFFESSIAQNVHIKKVVGNVEFVVGEKRTVVKPNSSFSEKSGLFVLKDKNSQLIIRIGDEVSVLYFSEERSKYPLKKLISPKQDLEKKEDGFLDKIFSFFDGSFDNDVKINNMIVSTPNVSVRSVDTNIISIEAIEVLHSYPLKIDFSSFIDRDINENIGFNILVKNDSRIIFNQTITETYFIINDTTFDLNTDWDIEINNISSSKKIKGKIESKKYIKTEERKLFDQLKDKAISESKTDESTYQIIFIESLLSRRLISNASYFLDLFIETNNNNKLINYRDYHTKNQ